MNPIKRILLFTLTLTLLLGCFTGCGAGSDPGISAAPGGKAMGRYVEQELPIPELKKALDLVTLSDGRLRLAGTDASGNTSLYTRTDGESWEITPLPDEVQGSGHVVCLALAADGRVFCYTALPTEDSNSIQSHHLWVLEADGQYRELPNAYPDMGSVQYYLIYKCDFTAQGKLMAAVNYLELRELDLETGAFGENQNDPGILPDYLGCAGEDTYFIGSEGGIVCTDGNVRTPSDAAGEQLLSTVADHSGMDNGRISLWANAEGYLFYVTNQGLYSAVPGGSVVEELVDGDRTSIGSSVFTPIALTGLADGSFCVLARNQGKNVLYRYFYDETASTEPEKHLRVYSLNEDDALRQAVSLFQKQNPGIAVDLEIGITGDDGVTAADAVKTLNTQILSGSGPDVLNLDGLPLESFLEKDVLADLNGVISQSEPLLTQVVSCYARDGQTCAIPTGFILPAIYGPREIVSRIHDMDSLLSAVVEAKAQSPKGKYAIRERSPSSLADKLYDSCSAAWLREDGTLDEGKLTEYYTGLKTLFDMDEGAWDSREDDPDYVPGYLPSLNGAITVCYSGAGCDIGTLNGMDWWSSVLMGDQLLEGYDVMPLYVQASGVFLPKRIMGILNTTRNRPEAEAFLTFLLSDAVQGLPYGNGFPVNLATMDRQIAEDKTVESGMSVSDDEGNNYDFAGLYPDARRRQELKTWAEALTTPALTDQTIRNTVIEQAALCLNGSITPEEAAKAALRSLNLYLSE